MKDNNCPNSKERGLEEQLKSFVMSLFPVELDFPHLTLARFCVHLLYDAY